VPNRSKRAPSRAASSEATRRSILDAAAAILSGREADELSIRDVCARAGVTAPTIYHHFADRQTLIDRVVDDCFASFDRWLVDRSAPTDSIEALHWGFDRYVEFGVAHPTQYRLLFGRRHARPSPQGIIAYDRLRRAMRDVADAGRLRVDVDEATLAYWSVAHGVTALAVLGVLPRRSPIAALAREAIVARLVRNDATARRRRSRRPTSEAAPRPRRAGQATAARTRART
jgi:AcrR family transcriptional regulator